MPCGVGLLPVRLALLREGRMNVGRLRRLLPVRGRGSAEPTGL
ncbi:hypothetical protein [Streptomyces sp. BA2]|nr:hypothetical protein [Streptomyces sp. BA2]